MKNTTVIENKYLLFLSIPVISVFAVTGMDFIGFYTSIDKIYTRSLSNVLTGFLFTTLILFFFPVLINRIFWKKPLSYFGTGKGNIKIGLIISAFYLLLIPVFLINSKNQSMIDTYPLAKDALNSWSFFVFYEFLYIAFYYIPYEFFFRGVLQMGLSKNWHKWHSILFVTVITTALHITKPLPEIAGAAIAGFLLGIIAEKTNSWFYPLIVHVITGVSTDIFCSLYFTGVL